MATPDEAPELEPPARAPAAFDPTARVRAQEIPPLLLRGVVGGTLMGLANLVPGISGGTMLLASGIYPRFIAAVAEVTTLRWRLHSVLVLVCVVASAGLGILLLAGPIKVLVVEQRWAMYSLFVGLTLGGVPVVWRMARPATAGVARGAGAGFVAMVGLTLLQLFYAGDTGQGASAFLLLVAGLAGASAMILPGVSGGYLLLLLGQYVPILSAVDDVKVALGQGDLAQATGPVLTTLLPVAVGVLVGVVAVSNLLRWLLRRFEKATLGFLLGLMLGAVVGLWPFQRTADPVPGVTRIKGQLVTVENLATFDAEDYPSEYFRPTVAQGLAALGLLTVGGGLTLAVSRLGR